MNGHHTNKAHDDRQQPCVDHPFKKARYAWQIKGYLNSGNRQCFPIACTSDPNSHEERLSEIHDEKQCESVSISIDCSKNKKDSSGLMLESFLVEPYFENSNEVREKKRIESTNEEDIDKSMDSALHCYTDVDKNCCVKRKSESPPVYKGPTAKIRRIKIKSENLTQADESFSPPNESHDNSREVNSLSSYMWQKREMGFAIVDNVCNETLEVMGVSPDPIVNSAARARLALEDHGIQTAIKTQGLYTGNEQKQGNEMEVFVNDYDHKDEMQDDILTSNGLNTFMCSDRSDCLHRSSNNKTSSNNDINAYLNMKTVTCDPLCEINQFENNTDKSDDKSVLGLPGSPTFNEYCGSVDQCDSPGTHDTRKSSDLVLDLAVSAAIITQGLTFENPS